VTPPSDPLVAFLNARLGEEEAAARDSPPSLGMLTRWVEVFGDGESRAEAHYSRHDPARVLAEVDAKRRIVALHSADPRVDHISGRTDDGEVACLGCNANFQEGYAESVGGCPTKRLLALPYAGHPDYDPGWRP
jgi:hypothetical protein